MILGPFPKSYQRVRGSPPHGNRRFAENPQSRCGRKGDGPDDHPGASEEDKADNEKNLKPI
jgi:hypothetical protein